MAVLRTLGTQVGFTKIGFLHFLMDRTDLTQKQARVLADLVTNDESIEFETLGFSDQDFTRLNNLGVDFEIFR